MEKEPYKSASYAKGWWDAMSACRENGGEKELTLSREKLANLFCELFGNGEGVIAGFVDYEFADKIIANLPQLIECKREDVMTSEVKCAT